ncbi:MAG: hypothetical protein ACRDY4_15095 [Acidimicrobiia bacterium]
MRACPPALDDPDPRYGARAGVHWAGEGRRQGTRVGFEVAIS